MGVNMSKGCSGNRSDARPSLPSGKSQPIQITTTNAADATKYPTCKSTTPAGNRMDCNMPTGGTNDMAGGAV
jgi:hypothetical protein